MTDFDHIIALGMPALLDHSDTKEAILKYIWALTDNLKPKDEQWREICYFQSDEERIDPEVDRDTLQKNKKCRLLVMGFWDRQQGIGNLRAYQVGIQDYNPRDIYLKESLYYYSSGKGNIANHVFPADSYMDVIKVATSWYGTAFETWKAKTKALPDTKTEDDKS